MKWIEIIALVIALWLLGSIVVALTRIQLGIAVIAQCYVSWLKSQEDTAHIGQAIEDTLTGGDE